MRFKLNELRRIIRTLILEGEEVYDDTALPGEEADEDLLAEPDLTDQEERDDYINSRQAMKSKKKKARLRSRDETEEGMGDEHAIVGAVGPLGAGNGPGRKPYSKKMKSKNAMSRPLDEYDE